ncbi:MULTISPECIES: hypothetical protein [unclassified Mesorhizobium]|uniref:hypothetical protein n=1 Tax=unclassified Mesorhizobium TaxID=325217 RepID=UPI00333BE0A3
MRIAIATAALIIAALPAHAMSGAELLQQTRSFGEGYVLGVVEVRTGVLDKDDPKFMQIRTCVLNAHVASDTLYEATVEWLRRNPKDLTFPAFGAVYKLLDEMCGA